MINLTEDDSVKRVEDATERHVRLCRQNPNADKHVIVIQPLYLDMEAKKTQHEQTEKDVNAAQDTVWLWNNILNDALRDLHGRAKEYDRNHPGSKTCTLIFPGGNITPIIALPDPDRPDAAQAIVQKTTSLGTTHELFPLAEKIDKAITSCNDAAKQLKTAIQSEGNANTVLTISKIALVRKYNANYFVAASDVDKAFAERLFPPLRVTKKKKKDNGKTANTTVTAS